MTLACRGFKTESHKSTFIVMTSWVRSKILYRESYIISFVRSFLSASITEELKYSLKALFPIFFKLAFVVRSTGCNRCVMLFGTITDSIPCFDRTSNTLILDWVLKVPHIGSISWLFGGIFSHWHFLIYGTRACSIRQTVSFSLHQCFSLYGKTKNHQGNQRLGAIFLSFLCK